MTAYVTAAWQNLLLRSLASSILPAAHRGLPGLNARQRDDNPETQPMLYRSEGFAEDLFDTYPSH